MKRSRLKLSRSSSQGDGKSSPLWKRTCKDSEAILLQSSSQITASCPQLHPLTSHLPGPAGSSSTIGNSQVTPPIIHPSEAQTSLPRSGLHTKTEPRTSEDSNDVDTCCPGNMDDDEFWAQASACVTASQLTHIGVGKQNVVKKQTSLFSFMAVEPSAKKPNGLPVLSSGGRGDGGTKEHRAKKITNVEPKMVDSAKKERQTSTRTCPFYKRIPGIINDVMCDCILSEFYCRHFFYCGCF